MKIKSIYERMSLARIFTLLLYTRDYVHAFGVWRTIQVMVYFTLISTVGRILKIPFIHIDKLKIYLIPNDLGISNELKLFKVHEPLATRIFKKQLKTGMNIIDIGSNIGYYALIEAQECGDVGRVIAIEPNPLSYQYLRKNIHANELTNVITKNLAIWDREGILQFLISSNSNLCRVVGLRNNLISEEATEENNIINVPATTLDYLFEELCQQHKICNVDLIRMDVEGAEWHIFNGAWKVIQKFLPNIFIELHISILGELKSRLLLNKLKVLGYEIKYCIFRQLDIPGVSKDIKFTSIDSLISDLSSITRYSFPFALLLLMENNSKPIKISNRNKFSNNDKEKL